ncbi:MAG: hypothetical protein ACW99A_03315 [Candidatus Kariarchaeaceae archaeon]|jgi:hypothetical protein
MDEDRTNRSTTADPNDYKEIVPLLPVLIPSGGGEFMILECVDKTDDTAIIQMDKSLMCTIKIKYGNKKAKVTFPFELRSENIPTTGGITWLRP